MGEGYDVVLDVIRFMVKVGLKMIMDGFEKVWDIVDFVYEELWSCWL